MKTVLTTLLATVVALSSAQTLNIPRRNGNIISSSRPIIISGSSNDMQNREYDRGRPCDTDADTGSDSAVFILENGATLSNAIIGVNQLEGVHCRGACTLRNVWFRDVCEGKYIRSSHLSNYALMIDHQMPSPCSAAATSSSKAAVQPMPRTR